MKVNFQGLFSVANVLQTSPEFSGVVGVLNIEYPEISRLISAQRKRRNAQMLNKFIISYGHYAISLLLHHGVDKQTVAELAGHADTSFLERTYCHPQMELKNQAANIMAETLLHSA